MICKGVEWLLQLIVPLQILIKRGVCTMAKNTVPEAKEALNRFKMEAAAEVGVFLH